MTKYRLMGLDRFDYEEYSCGDYDTFEEAEKERIRRAGHDNSFGTGMGDRYWVEHEGQCKHCNETFFGTAEMIQHGLKAHHDMMRELGYSEEQLIKDVST